jgi:neutral ceramidase
MALKAATAQCDITPPIGAEMCGYGYYLQRRATGVLDPLLAKALVLESGGVQAAIVSCDLIGLTEATVAAARRLIEKRTGIPGAHLLFACSHTHAGPTTIEVRGCGSPEAAFTKLLPEYLAGVVSRAVARLQPARIGFAVGEVKGLALNRVEGDDGPLDRELPVMRVEAMDESVLATVYSASAHGVSLLSSNTMLSADWIGIASRRIEQTTGGAALFLQGSCGDVNPVLVHTGSHEEAGRLAAEQVERLLERMDMQEDAEVEVASREVAFPLHVTPADELQESAAQARAKLEELPPGPETFGERATARFELEWAEEALAMHLRGMRNELRTELQALRTGDALLLAHGGELFCEFGIALKERFAPRPTFVVGYANGLIGYVPDPEDFERRGYAAVTVPKMLGNFPFTSDVGSRLVAGFTELAAEVGA